MTTLEWAKNYRDLGLHPIPVESKGKNPLIKWRNYQTTAPTDEDLQKWFAGDNTNIGIILGRGKIAVDLDGGKDAERLLYDAGIILPENAPRAMTGNGYHVLLSVSQDQPDCVGLFSTNGGKPQVDIRGKGYIVAEPSIHPNGVAYRWLTPIEEDIPAAPSRLLEVIQQKTAPHITTGNQPGWVTTALRGAKEGGRNALCAKLAGFFASKMLDAELVKTILADTFCKRCVPPFDEREMCITVDSIFRRHGLESDTVEFTPKHISEVAQRVIAALESKKPKFVSAGLPEIDHYLGGGFAPGELIYLGARPGVGKTAFALQIATQAARSGSNVLVISREMSNEALVRRMISQQGKVNASILRRFDIQKDIGHWEDISRSLSKLVELPVWFSDEAFTIKQVLEMASKMPELGFMIVDHLQLVRSGAKTKDRRQEIEMVSVGLKQMTLQFKIPILCMSTLSRPPDKSNAKPTLSSLRESGELEHDADVVLFIHREFRSQESELIIAKAREGKTGVVIMTFVDGHLTFNAAQGDDNDSRIEAKSRRATDDYESGELQY